MIFCNECGRWIAATAYQRHENEHKAQELLDHTGPHGRCNCERFGPACSCPDPFYSGGTAICACCQGTLNRPVPSI